MMSLSFAKIVALLLLAFTSCLSSVEAKVASHQIRRRAVEGEVVEIDPFEGDVVEVDAVEGDKKTRTTRTKRRRRPNASA